VSVDIFNFSELDSVTIHFTENFVIQISGHFVPLEKHPKIARIVLLQTEAKTVLLIATNCKKTRLTVINTVL
jgi:hypothetical protein